MFLELSEAIPVAATEASSRKIFLDLCMSIWACSGIRQTEKMFLDLSESIPAQASTELNQKNVPGAIRVFSFRRALT